MPSNQGQVPETVEKIAREFHDEYEAWAAANGWETQESTRTSFDDLPAANRETMLATVQALLDRKIISAPVTQPEVPEALIERLNHHARQIALEQPHDPYTAETVLALDEAIALLKSSGIPAPRKQFAEELAGEFEERAAIRSGLYKAAVRAKNSAGELVHGVAGETLREIVALTRKWATRDVVGEGEGRG